MQIRGVDGRYVRTSEPIFCKDCGAVLGDYRSVRCRSCSKKELYKDKTKNPMFGKVGKLNYMFGRRGKKNHFYGKRHTKKTKLILKACQLGRTHPYKPRPAIAGENNPFWQGGNSFKEYPQAFTRGLREKIRRRDGYKCKKCALPEKVHLLLYGRKLHVHHIDYNKCRCEENNLVSLCLPCHGQAAYQRSYWKKYYRSILCEK